MTRFEVALLGLEHGAKLFHALITPLFVEDLTVERLKSLGADAVIFDHDGVLGPSRSDEPDQTGVRAIETALNVFGPDKVFILSNTISRRDTRKASYEKIMAAGARYIQARPKPDPEGIYMASSISGVPVSRIATLDDGLLTGVLMGVSTGAIVVYTLRRRLTERFGPRIVRISTTWPQIVLTVFFYAAGFFIGKHQ